MNFLNTARRYVGSLQEKPGKTQMQLIKNADEKVNEIMIKTDNFFMADWPEYRANIEDTKFTLFKD